MFFFSSAECEPLTASICRDLEYNATRFPTLLGHKTQQEASFKIQQLFRGIQCSQYAKRFLCSLYFPPCSGHSNVLRPCRTLCERARTSCQLTSSWSRSKWAEYIRCEQFPDKSQESCFDGVVSEPAARTSPSKCSKNVTDITIKSICGVSSSA